MAVESDYGWFVRDQGDSYLIVHGFSSEDGFQLSGKPSYSLSKFDEGEGPDFFRCFDGSFSVVTDPISDLVRGILDLGLSEGDTKRINGATAKRLRELSSQHNKHPLSHSDRTSAFL